MSKIITKNIQSDEIDFREVFNKLWISKLRIILITIIVTTISFLYNTFYEPISYKSNFTVNTGIQQKNSLECGVDLFGFYKCIYLAPSF